MFLINTEREFSKLQNGMKYVWLFKPKTPNFPKDQLTNI